MASEHGFVSAFLNIRLSEWPARCLLKVRQQIAEIKELKEKGSKSWWMTYFLWKAFCSLTPVIPPGRFHVSFWSNAFFLGPDSALKAAVLPSEKVFLIKNSKTSLFCLNVWIYLTCCNVLRSSFSSSFSSALSHRATCSALHGLLIFGLKILNIPCLNISIKKPMIVNPYPHYCFLVQPPCFPGLLGC